MKATADLEKLWVEGTPDEKPSGGNAASASSGDLQSARSVPLPGSGVESIGGVASAGTDMTAAPAPLAPKIQYSPSLSELLRRQSIE